MGRRRRHPPILTVPPLPAGAAPYQDDIAARFYAAEKSKAEYHMREFDRQPRQVRLVEHAVGNVEIARKLVAQGIGSAEEAEPVVREMLERRSRRG